jgi:hypothetical protein
MFENRRNFLTILVGAAAPLAIFVKRLAGQGKPAPPPIDRAQNPEKNDGESPTPKSATKAILEANDKDIKKNVERLYELASELKTEVEKTDSVQVLSLGMLKKAEEIEKLAHEIKSRAKG